VAETAERIVVGVDGSEKSRQALHWALDEARLRGASLHVVHAFPEPCVAPHGPSIPGMVRAMQNLVGRPEQVLEHSLVGLAGGEVPLRSEVVAAPAAPALIDSARGAALLVVGSRGRGGFGGLFLGSVSQQCVAHGPCPVVVVRGDGAPRQTTSARERCRV
jgi:nucleotide-binding universal stress UspA family protein